MADVTKEGGMSLALQPKGDVYAVAKDPAQSLTLIASKRPAEELYVIHDDPGQLNNVAEDPVYAAVRVALASQLSAEMERTHDPWSTGDGSIFDSYKYYAIDKPGNPLATQSAEQ